MLKHVVRSVIAGIVLLLPTAAFAQATLAGVVKDASGAVMPGVTVEATSDALIEKVRTAVTDGAGQFRIIDLPSGTYRVTFALAGFATVQRRASSSPATSLRRLTPSSASAGSRKRSPSPAKHRSSTCRAPCGRTC